MISKLFGKIKKHILLLNPNCRNILWWVNVSKWVKIKFHSCHLIMKSLFHCPHHCFLLCSTHSNQLKNLLWRIFVSVMETNRWWGPVCICVVAMGKGRYNWKVFPLGSMNLILQVMNFASKCKPNSKLLVF